MDETARDKVRAVSAAFGKQLSAINEYVQGDPLDVGDREFMRGHMKKLRLLVPQLAAAIEQVGK